ncbi:MAG: chloride channel protein [Ferruginibacter sp.]
MNNLLNNGIPISVSLATTLDMGNEKSRIPYNKKRLITISALAVVVAVAISLVARLLVYLINAFTNISFYGQMSVASTSPADNGLGIWVILIPVAGGLLVGMMAFYGSKAIRGHGIPEAMEQILTKQSKIKPSIVFLKPVSSAISIGTGGPFGAEGPIIATGGALGSTLGQLIKISDNERKILLAAGATAGMAAIFGSPIAAIFLAIELLLFEFSPRSIIPVALACITGAAGHHFLFGSAYLFGIDIVILSPTNQAIFAYSIIGVIIGLLSVFVTKVVYFIEDAFERLPVHWAWWPAIGGFAVGVIGYFFPKTLGVGYDNITDVLSGTLPVKIMLSLCIMKFISWAIALGSGTSGGTLAPLLTIGGAAGALLGVVINMWFPFAGVTIPLAAVVGMSAMFAGASRAFLTSIIFALETTGQSNILLPLLSSCTAAYFISFFIMENTIMTEKIARRGIRTPDSYEPDILERIPVADVIEENGVAISEENTVGEVRAWIGNTGGKQSKYFIVSSNEGEFRGIINSSELLNHQYSTDQLIATLVNRKHSFLDVNSSLKAGVELMARDGIDVLAIVSVEDGNAVKGIISYADILSAYKSGLNEHKKKQPHISLKRNGLKIMLHGRNLFAGKKNSKK